MIKNIIIAVLVVLTASLFIYSNLRANEATKQEALARENAEEARLQAQLALEAAADAKREQARAEALAVQLQECQSGK